MSSGDSFIKTPKQLITVVILSFVVPIAIIFLLVAYVNSAKLPSAGKTAEENAQATIARIQPVAGHELKVAGAAGALKSGQDVFNAQCAACHKEGLANAPKFGDAGAWGPRIKAGFEALVASALKGKGAMAAQGGGEFNDTEIARAVAYMANAGGAKFDEPKGPAAAAAPAADAAPAAAAPAAAAAAPAAAAAAAAPAAAMAAAAPAGGTGKALFDSVCTTCHAAGGSFPGSPKLGDKAAWADRLKAGVPALVASVIKGKGAMPAKGGKSDASDADIKAAVEYMVASVK